MSSQTHARQPSGVPIGGQFAATAHAESGVSLAPAPRPPITESRTRGVFEVFNTTAEVMPRREGSPFTQTRLHMGGKPDLRAQAGVAALRMQRSEQEDTVQAKLEELAAKGSKATVLVQSSNGNVDAREGTLISMNDGIALINKGSSAGKGIYLQKAGLKMKILGVLPGYGKAPVLADRFRDHLDEVPQLVPATFDGIPEADEDKESPSDIATVYVFNHPGFEPGQDGRGSVFFVTDFMPGDGGDDEYGAGIVNGYGVYPAGSGLCSEHGSMYASQLKRWGGRVDGYKPGSHTFRDVMNFDTVADRHNDIEAVWSSVARSSE